MDKIPRRPQPDGKGIVMEVQGSSKEKECLAFMINKMSKRISLPKQRPQSCEAAGQKGHVWMGRLPLVSPTAAAPALETRMTQSCVNSWGKHPLAVLCESDKNNTTKHPALGYALDGSVFPGQEGLCQAGAGSPANAHQGSTFLTSIFSPMSLPVLTGNRR